jgi:hypothetical protein
MLLGEGVMSPSGNSSGIASSASDASVVDSTSSNSSDNSDLPPPGLCTVKAVVRVHSSSNFDCAYYVPDPFTGKVTYLMNIEVLTLIAGDPSCVCPNWHARVTVEGAQIVDSSGTLVPRLSIPVACGRDSHIVTALFDPAVPLSVHGVTVELKSNPEVDPGPLNPDWVPSKCCGKIFLATGSVKLPPKCGDTTMVPTP